jgi:hypothetical protein
MDLDLNAAASTLSGIGRHIAFGLVALVNWLTWVPSQFGTQTITDYLLRSVFTFATLAFAAYRITFIFDGLRSAIKNYSGQSNRLIVAAGYLMDSNESRSTRLFRVFVGGLLAIVLSFLGVQSIMDALKNGSASLVFIAGGGYLAQTALFVMAVRYGQQPQDKATYPALLAVWLIGGLAGIATPLGIGLAGALGIVYIISLLWLLEFAVNVLQLVYRPIGALTVILLMIFAILRHFGVTPMWWWAGGVLLAITLVVMLTQLRNDNKASLRNKPA